MISMVAESLGVVRVARQVLTTIVINAALQVPGVIRMAQMNDQWSRLLGREVPRQGVTLTIKDNTVTTDLYIVVANDVNIVNVGSAVQEEVAAAIEHMVGMHVREVNVYIQDVA
ncbi:MAG: Asp23/Gls24 family envelope stress response protein [Chloroflexi bacterium]|nr:MAG: Asp23/Gls24 family envelope stress response protein [Chloroflexota bacterium]